MVARSFYTRWLRCRGRYKVVESLRSFWAEIRKHGVEQRMGQDLEVSKSTGGSLQCLVNIECSIARTFQPQNLMVLAARVVLFTFVVGSRKIISINSAARRTSKIPLLPTSLHPMILCPSTELELERNCLAQLKEILPPQLVLLRSRHDACHQPPYRGSRLASRLIR